MIFMMAVEQEYDELNMAIKMFQDTMMRVRYLEFQYSCTTRNDFGGCEMSLHAEVAAAETYMGLLSLVLELFLVVVVLRIGIACIRFIPKK
jgi:3-hydroxyacyl-CoA dehydrogenase